MKKLIDRLRAEPTPAAVEALRRYVNKHPMAVCMATADDLALLRQHGIL